MDSDAVASLYEEDGKLKSDALDNLLSKDVERVKSLKPNTTEIFNNGYKKAEKEIMQKFEKDFIEQTGYSSDLKGIELVMDYINSNKSSSSSTQKGLSDDDVKRHKLYLDAVDNAKKIEKEINKKWQEKFDAREAEIKGEKVFNDISSEAMSLLDSMKPILSSDANKANNQKSWFIKELQQYQYDIQEGRKIVLKDGKVLEDEHGNRIDFDSFVKNIADKFYDFNASDQRSSPPKPDGKSTTTFTLKKPTSNDEYVKMIEEIRSDNRLSSEQKTQKSVELTNLYTSGEVV